MKGELISYPFSFMSSWIKTYAVTKTSGTESLLGLGGLLFFSSFEPTSSSSPLLLFVFCALPLSSFMLVRPLLARALTLFSLLPFLTYIPPKDLFPTTFTDELAPVRQFLHYMIVQDNDSFFLASSLVSFRHISALLKSQRFIWIYGSNPFAGAYR